MDGLREVERGKGQRGRKYGGRVGGSWTLEVGLGKEGWRKYVWERETEGTERVGER